MRRVGRRRRRNNQLSPFDRDHLRCVLVHPGFPHSAAVVSITTGETQWCSHCRWPGGVVRSDNHERALGTAGHRDGEVRLLSGPTWGGAACVG